MKKSTVDAKFDILKFVMSLMVVAIHTSMLPKILYPWLRLAVPLFFLMTSYFLFRKFAKCDNASEQRMVIKAFVVRNLKLYGFWFLLLLPYTLYLRRNVYLSGAVWEGLKNLIKDFLFSSTFAASWFIMASVIGVLLVFLVSKWNNKILLFLSILVYIVVVGRSSYMPIVKEINWLSEGLTIYQKLFGTPVLSFPASLFWIVCGKCFADGTFQPKKVPCGIITVLSAILLYGEWNFVQHLTGSMSCDCYFMLPGICLGFFGWFLCQKDIQMKSSVYLRRCSTVIYASHATIIRFFLRKVMNIYDPSTAFLLAAVLSIVIYVFIELLLYWGAKRKVKVIKVLTYAY